MSDRIQVIETTKNTWTRVLDKETNVTLTNKVSGANYYIRYVDIEDPEPTGVFDPDKDYRLFQKKTVENISYNNAVCGFVYTTKKNGKIAISRQTYQNVRTFEKHCPLSMIPFNQIKEETTLSVQAVQGEYTITVTDATGIIADRYIIITDNISENTFYGFVQSVLGNVITLNVPVNDNFLVGSEVYSTNIYLNVIGSKVSQHIFKRRLPTENLGKILVITKLILVMETGTTPELNDFGDIADGIDNGLVIRFEDGQEKHLFTFRSNAELSAQTFNFQILTATNPALGLDGIRANINLLETIGSAIELKDNENIKIIVQDDLSSIVRFAVIPQGYFLN